MFPMIDLAIKPKPNAALVWYGRDLAGVADIRQVIFPFILVLSILFLQNSPLGVSSSVR